MEKDISPYAGYLQALYPGANSEELATDLLAVIQTYPMPKPSGHGNTRLPLSEKDTILITYGDSILPGHPPADVQARLGVGGGYPDTGKTSAPPPLACLHRFVETYAHRGFGAIHILPFNPYTSDDGFSVVDYYQVNPRLGTWDHVQELGKNYRIMADLVLNHCSAKSPWFKAYLEGNRNFDKYFIDLPPDTDVSQVVRPRTHPLLTGFPGKTTDGENVERHIWTTFSADQVDLNFSNPRVLLKMVDALLFLISKGCEIIRLDAIAYLWKELGTSCIHHPNTHRVVQLMRTILDNHAPHAVIITETNVPHRENISYFGNRMNEAHMIYQFSLPPLILHSFLTGSAQTLSTWAKTIEVTPYTTYLNFASSHDGIGMTPTHGILSQQEQDNLVQSVLDRGGKVNYKATSEGPIPYELNTTFFSAVCEPSLPEQDRVQKFLASQSILCILPGVPALYIHSLLGSQNFTEGLELTGANRALNREKLFLAELEEQLANPEHLRTKILTGILNMLEIRRSSPAFGPTVPHIILDVNNPSIFAVQRSTGKRGETIVALVNTKGSDQTCTLNHNETPKYQDLLTKTIYESRELVLGPWQYLWLVPAEDSINTHPKEQP